MNKSKYVFSQLVEFLDYVRFCQIIDKYGGNRYMKYFTCWNQQMTLMFGQLSNRDRLFKKNLYEIHATKQNGLSPCKPLN